MASVSLSATATLRNSQSQTPIAGVGGAACAIGEVVYKSITTGLWSPAIATALATLGTSAGSGRLGLCVAGCGAANQDILILMGGSVTTSGLTAGVPYFVATDVAGDIAPVADVDTANGYLALVGFAKSATELILMPYVLGVTI